MKKRLLVLTMIGVMTVSACACGSVASQSADTTASTVAASSAETSEVEAGSETEASQAAETEAASTEAIAEETEETAPDIDIEGCDTFTQIIDKKLSDGMGYANEKVGDTDVFFVSSGTYDNLDGNMAAIDAALFVYNDDGPYEIGKVVCGGTAYPLAIQDGKLFVSSGHWISTYTIKDNELVMTERASVEFDTDGNETYSLETVDGVIDDAAKAESRFNELFEEYEKATVIGFSTVGGDETSSEAVLPAYEYPGPELFYSVVYKYMIDELGAHYEPSDVGIPCPVIIAEDDSNKEDILLYGNFWYFNYKLNGDTLENTSGGSYPGVMHVKSTDAGYEVTGMDITEDGSGFTESAKKIFGKYYDTFMKDGEDDKLLEKTRAQIIANYVAANNLSITAYQDYGWDPVTLPEENIDSFYSKLD